MSTRRPLRFGFTAAPAGPEGASDEELYLDALEDCRFGSALGYDSIWTLEHHFSDYFPTPSPLLFMARLAAECPGVDLGTCVVVTPWYDPLRLAEEIAMLSILCSGELHLGVGRGTAKMEYDAFDIPMEEARGRFAEGMELIRKALGGEPFKHWGEHYRMGREVRLRPTPNAERVHFYGAIGSPESATIMADLGLPPLSVASFPLPMQRDIIEKWEERRSAKGVPIECGKPLVIGSFLAETDEKARRLAKEYVAPFYALQARHYETDAHYWKDIEGYRQHAKMFENLERLSDPANLDPHLDLQLTGTADTALERIEEYREIGFDNFVIHVAVSGMPRKLRREMLERFARDVIPRCSS